MSLMSNIIFDKYTYFPLIDVYQAAAQQRVIVVGGHARTVGAAGGWLTGGGHSAWSNLYGLGVDSGYSPSLQRSRLNRAFLRCSTNQSRGSTRQSQDNKSIHRSRVLLGY